MRSFNPTSVGTRRTQYERTKLFVGLSRCYRRRHRLVILEIDFRVTEMLDRLDLQASIVVDHDVHNEHRLAGRVYPQ